MSQQTAKRLPFDSPPKALKENIEQIPDRGYHGGKGEPPMDDWQQWRIKVDHRLDRVETGLDNVEKRLDNVEKRLDNVEIQLGEVRSEARTHFMWLIGLLITSLLGIIAAMFVIDQRQQGWIQHMQSVSQAQIESNNEANRALLEQLDRRHVEQGLYLQKQVDRLERKLE